MTDKEEVVELRKFINEYCRPTIKDLQDKNTELHLKLATYRKETK